MKYLKKLVNPVFSGVNRHKWVQNSNAVYNISV